MHEGIGMTGTVAHFNRARRFGHIIPDDANLPDLFTYWAFLEPPNRFLVSGWTVEFDPVKLDTDKPQAHHVRVISKTIARQTSGEGGAK